MSTWTDGTRWRAAGTAVLLLMGGALLGVSADRLWLSPPEAERNHLTPEAMVTRLGLSSSEEARIRALLDSLHAEIHAVIEHDPASMRAAVRSADQRIEAALPPGARAEFRAWMQEHREHMMDRMRGGPMDHDTMHEREPDAMHGDDHEGRR